MTHPDTTSVAIYKPTRKMLHDLGEWVIGKRGAASWSRRSGATADETIHALLREAAKSAPELKRFIREPVAAK